MNKYIFVIFIFVCDNVQAQFKPLVEIEFGYKNMTAQIGQDNKWYAANLRRYNMYSNVSIGIKNENWDIGTNIENYFGYESGTSFSPRQISYNTFVKYTFKKLTFTLDHFCSHPIISTISKCLCL